MATGVGQPAKRQNKTVRALYARVLSGRSVVSRPLAPRGLYVTIAGLLEPRYLKGELIAQARDLLAAEAAERHRPVVLIVGADPQPSAAHGDVRRARSAHRLRVSIMAMDLGASAAYLRHHVVLAGRDEPLFADDAVARLHASRTGFPRALSNAATAVLIAAATDNKDLVDDACAKRAVAELTRD